MTPKRDTPIQNVFLLVHPLFSNALFRGTIEDRRRIATFMLRKWRNEITRAAKDPQAILVIVESAWTGIWKNQIRRRTPGTRAFIEYADSSLVPRLFKLRAFAQRKMGPRLFVIPETAKKSAIASQLRERGFRLTDNWRGTSFGEYLRECVRNEAKALAKELKSRPKHLQPSAALSINGTKHAYELAMRLRRTKPRAM